jgi:transcriptional regulator with XRE-family HTH domain
MDTVPDFCALPPMHNRIAELRKARGWSMRELAHRTNSSASTINSLEKGKTELTLSWLRRLAKAFEAPVEEILGLPNPQLSSFSHPRSHPNNNVLLLNDVTPLPSNEPEFAIFNLADNHKLYSVTSTVLNQRIPFGYIIVVDKSDAAIKEMRMGDIVIGTYADGDNVSRLIRQFVPPNLLITNSSDNNLPSINSQAEPFQLEGKVLWAASPLGSSWEARPPA